MVITSRRQWEQRRRSSIETPDEYKAYSRSEHRGQCGALEAAASESWIEIGITVHTLGVRVELNRTELILISYLIEDVENKTNNPIPLTNCFMEFKRARHHTCLIINFSVNKLFVLYTKRRKWEEGEGEYCYYLNSHEFLPFPVCSIPLWLPAIVYRVNQRLGMYSTYYVGSSLFSVRLDIAQKIRISSAAAPLQTEPIDPPSWLYIYIYSGLIERTVTVYSDCLDPLIIIVSRALCDPIAIF